MKTSERFNRAIAALIKGYMNNTLRKGSCSACAVGNIVVESQNLRFTKSKFSSHLEVIDEHDYTIELRWSDVFITADEVQSVYPDCYTDKAKKEIDSTGYSWKELARIEKAFEQNAKINHMSYSNYTNSEIDEDQLNGLHAVVDVLCKIEGYDDLVAQENKALFVKCELA